jgi:hypothetical protein
MTASRFDQDMQIKRYLSRFICSQPFMHINFPRLIFEKMRDTIYKIAEEIQDREDTKINVELQIEEEMQTARPMQMQD